MFHDADTYHLFTLTQPYTKPFWGRVCYAMTYGSQHEGREEYYIHQAKLDGDHKICS